MFKHIKRGLLLSGIMFIPMVAAQVKDSLSASGGVLEETFRGVFDIIGSILLGIFGGFYDLLQKSPIYGKIIISIVIGIILYDRLKDIEALKERASIIASVIAIITFVGLPSNLIETIFNSRSSGIVMIVGMIFAGIVLAISKGDSNWAHFGRFTSYIMLTVGLAGVTTFSGENSILQTGAALLTAGCGVAAIWNVLKIKWTKELREEFGNFSTPSAEGIGEKAGKISKAPSRFLGGWRKGRGDKKEDEDKKQSSTKNEEKNEDEKLNVEDFVEKDEDKKQRLETSFRYLDKIKEDVKKVSKISSLLNNNMCIKNPTKENLKRSYNILIEIAKIFNKEKVSFLHNFGYKELNHNLGILVRQVTYYLDYISRLMDKDLDEIRKTLEKDKSELKDRGNLITNLLKGFPDGINNLQRNITKELEKH